MAAIGSARQGHSVALVDLDSHVCGMVSGGLVATDMGDRMTVGGLADEFFKRVVKYYADKYGPDSKELKACRNGATFEPHVAELLFEHMLAEQPNISVWKSHRYRSVAIDSDRSHTGHRVLALVVDDLLGQSTRTFSGEIFIDASYEGDVMAGARVPYRIGRESRAEYDKQLAGVSMGPKEQRGMGDTVRRLTTSASPSHRTPRTAYSFPSRSSTPPRHSFPRTVSA